MNLSSFNPDELWPRCAWCHRRMSADRECFGAGGRLSPEGRLLLARQEGRMVPMRLKEGREAIILVTAAGSEARAASNKIYFQTCSGRCLGPLVTALQAELAAGP